MWQKVKTSFRGRILWRANSPKKSSIFNICPSPAPLSPHHCWLGTKKLISHVLQLSPAQLISQNISLHDNTTGYRYQQQRQEVLSEVDRLSQINPLKVPASSRYLLEIDSSSFHNNSIKDQSYWLFTMRAACKARRWVAVCRYEPANINLRTQQPLLRLTTYPLETYRNAPVQPVSTHNAPLANTMLFQGQ